MKCPKCGGEPKIIHWTHDQPRYICCERCGGTGQVDSMTNMEWMQSIGIEQLADKLTDFSFWLVPTLPSEERHEYIRKKMMEWLKEKHE